MRRGTSAVPTELQQIKFESLTPAKADADLSCQRQSRLGTPRHKEVKKTRMKRRIAARTPARIAPSSQALPNSPPGAPPATVLPEPAASSDKKWEIDGPEGAAPAPHIRANMISFRVSDQGRIQVAFFDQD